MRIKRVLFVVFVLFFAGLIGLSGALAGGYAVYRVMANRVQNPAGSLNATTASAVSSQTKQVFLDSTDIETSITRSVQAVAPAVVTVVGTVPGQMTFFGLSGDQTVSSSGVFISDQGYILTNNHVVEGTTSVSIVLQDGEQHEATIVGTDKYADLAVLKTSVPVPAVASLGDSSQLNPGETVIAIGSPLGEFKNSVTVGVISGTGRSIDTGNGYSIEDLLQTDAAINQGNSGGPLVNLAGEVIGINTLIVRNSDSGTVAEGLGFAIASKTVQAVSTQIIEKGYFSRPYLGVQAQQITPYIASRYQLPVEWGSYVTQVASDGPGAKAGIKEGDIITKMGDITMDETHTYINTLYHFQAGDKIALELNRNGETVTVEVTLGESKGK
jgi:serine protease Do